MTFHKNSLLPLNGRRFFIYVSRYQLLLLAQKTSLLIGSFYRTYRLFPGNVVFTMSKSRNLLLTNIGRNAHP